MIYRLHVYSSDVGSEGYLFCDIWDDEAEATVPAWELPDALAEVRAYGEPRYRLREVRLMEEADDAA